jgi:hypothetical protein
MDHHHVTVPLKPQHQATGIRVRYGVQHGERPAPEIRHRRFSVGDPVDRVRGQRLRHGFHPFVIGQPLDYRCWGRIGLGIIRHGRSQVICQCRPLIPASIAQITGYMGFTGYWFLKLAVSAAFWASAP